MGSHEGVGGIHLGSGEEGGMRREGDRGGASETGEPVHHVNEEGVHDGEQGRPGGAPLLKPLLRKDTQIQSVNMEMDVLMEGAKERDD
eukprot:12888785-Prorocentrum_lima.AAC.1